MKVCILSLEYPPYVYGGAGVHVNNLSKALAKEMEVEIRACGDPRESVKENPHVKFYPMGDRYSGMIYSKVLNTMVLDMDMTLELENVDIVHSHTWYMTFAAQVIRKLYGIPIVATVHSLEPHRPWKREQLGSGYDLTTHLERSLYGMADGIITVSAATKRDLLEVYPEVDTEKISVIHNGIDLAKFKPNHDKKILKKLNIEDDYFLFLGRLSRQKGIFDLLEACRKKLFDRNLVLVTGAADTNEIYNKVEKEIKNLDNVLWINKMLSYEMTRALYTNARVFLCPSRYEPFGIINLEAMACECPVVAANVGGIPEVIEDGYNGILFEAGDIQGMADKVNHLNSNEDLRLKYICRGSKILKSRFSWDMVANETIKFYRKVIARCR